MSTLGRNSGLAMPSFFRAAVLCAVSIMSLADASPLAAEPAGEGTVGIYYLDTQERVAGIVIHGTIDKDVAGHAKQLIKFLRPDVDELTVYLNSPGGDVLAAIDLGEEVRNQWAFTAMDDDGECLGACVLVLAAGARRAPTADKVGLRRPSVDPKDRASPKNAALAKKVQTYLARMGMPKKLFQDMMQQDKVLLLNAARLKTLGLEGTGSRVRTVAAHKQPRAFADSGLRRDRGRPAIPPGSNSTAASHNANLITPPHPSKQGLPCTFPPRPRSRCC